MTVADYKPFIERVINRYEGGYGWDDGDPGGPTKYGITCYDLAEFDHEKMTSMAAWASKVRAMTLSTADTIYADKYATQCGFDQLNAGPDCVVCDFGINSGSSRSIKYAQEIVGAPVDGIMGPDTLAAINAYSAHNFVNELCAARLKFLRGLGTWGRFGRGWSARVKDLNAYSLALIPKPAGAVAKPPKPERPTRIGDAKDKRILKAFAKAYHPDDLKELKRLHAGP